MTLKYYTKNTQELRALDGYLLKHGYEYDKTTEDIINGIVPLHIVIFPIQKKFQWRTQITTGNYDYTLCVNLCEVIERTQGTCTSKQTNYTFTYKEDYKKLTSLMKEIIAKYSKRVEPEPDLQTQYRRDDYNLDFIKNSYDIGCAILSDRRMLLRTFS